MFTVYLSADQISKLIQSLPVSQYADVIVALMKAKERPYVCAYDKQGKLLDDGVPSLLKHQAG